MTFNTKNRKKLKTAVPKHKRRLSTFLINSSCIKLTTDETNQFKLQLEYKLFDKKNHFNANLAANNKLLPDRISENLKSCKFEDFHKLLCVYEEMLTKNIYANCDYTYKNLKYTINDPNIVLVSSDKKFHTCTLLEAVSNRFILIMSLSFKTPENFQKDTSIRIYLKSNKEYVTYDVELFVYKCFSSGHN